MQRRWVFPWFCACNDKGVRRGSGKRRRESRFHSKKPLRRLFHLKPWLCTSILTVFFHFSFFCCRRWSIHWSGDTFSIGLVVCLEKVFTKCVFVCVCVCGISVRSQYISAGFRCRLVSLLLNYVALGVVLTSAKRHKSVPNLSRKVFQIYLVKWFKLENFDANKIKCLKWEEFLSIILRLFFKCNL